MLEPAKSAQHTSKIGTPPAGKRRRRIVCLVAVIGAVCVVAFAISALVRWGGKWEAALGILLILPAIVVLIFRLIYWARQCSPSRDKSGVKSDGRTGPEPSSPEIGAIQSAPNDEVPPSPGNSAALADPQAAQALRDPAIRHWSGVEPELPGSVGTTPPRAPHVKLLGQRKKLAQRKDFSRRLPRPLDSEHSAYCLDQSGTDRLFVLAGSAIGAKHDQAGIPREDAVAFHVESHTASTVVAAVADGLSTARMSHMASALAVRLSVSWLSQWLANPALPSIFETWPQSADQLVASLGDTLDESFIKDHFATVGMSQLPGGFSERRQGKPAATLAVLVVDETSEGISAWWFTVGDCDVVSIDFSTGDVKWLTPRMYRQGPHTKAVPSHRQATASGQVLLSDGRAVVAMTDGMAELLDADQEYTVRALTAAHVRGNALGDLLMALDSRQQGNHDDRSLVAMGSISRT
jgi:hypothetical protein